MNKIDTIIEALEFYAHAWPTFGGIPVPLSVKARQALPLAIALREEMNAGDASTRKDEEAFNEALRTSPAPNTSAEYARLMELDANITPGPWYFVIKDDKYGKEPLIVGHSDTDESPVVCGCMSSEADSLLIAAAPDAIALLREMKAENGKLREVLKRYMAAFPAYRGKHIGAPGSEARMQQEDNIAREDQAKAALPDAEALVKLLSEKE